LVKSQFVPHLGRKSVAPIPSVGSNMTGSGITIVCRLNDIRPIDFWPKDVVFDLVDHFMPSLINYGKV